MRRLNVSFCKLQAEVSVTRQVNTILSSRLDKRTVFQMGMSRYSRSGSRCFEGESGSHFREAGCNIPTELIEACHRISKKNPTVIVKFSRRNDCQQVWNIKRDLRKIKMEDIDLSGQNKLFINKSLCPYYKVLYM